MNKFSHGNKSVSMKSHISLVLSSYTINQLIRKRANKGILISFLFLSVLFFISSCEKKEDKITVENQILQAYPGVNGELIDFIINGDTITVERINGEYVFQGDIILTEEQLKYSDTTKGSGFPLNMGVFRWPFGIIPYKIDATASHLEEKIKAAMDEIETYTSVSFIEHTIQLSYITFVCESGNSSNIGMRPFPQKIKLNSLASKGTAIHEICHALGMIHEFSRSDRDDWVIIYWDNINSLKYHNFYKIECLHNSYPFDFNSIMMYPSITTDRNFALDIEKPIITKKDGTGYDLNYSDLSQGDIEVINLMYSGDWIVAKPLVVTKVFDEKVEEATIGGTINFNGNAYVTERGVLWRESSTPESENQKIQLGQGEGSFSTILTGLTPNTYYVAQAYAINSAGPGFGAEIHFRTQPEPTIPEVSTNSYIPVTSTTAECGGTIITDGYSEVTDRGIYYGTLQNPESSGTKIQLGTGSGSFSTILSGLTPNTTYYVKAYATNSVGTNYGSQISFITSSSSNPVDVINPATGKTWMDRNLGATRVAISSIDTQAYGYLYQWGRGADGHQLRTSGTTTTLSSSDTPGHGNFILATLAAYDWRSPQNDNLWQGVSGVNNPCPSGYRLPTEAEWDQERLSWSTSNAAGAFASPLKLPSSGSRDPFDGGLRSPGGAGNYWSSTVGTDDYYGATSQLLGFNSLFAHVGACGRPYGCSVRCIKDY